ncbi:MAG: hypothetical protein IPM53_12500 [Anaerolineaceae bacterium]|nr:hypothetical protein [Anaerolineaceae bacterium]
MQSQTLSRQAVASGETSFLRRALQSDALFSLLSSLVFIFAADPVARFIGPDVPAWLILALGAGFVPYAASIYWITMAIEARWSYGRIIVALNAIWVVASYLVLFIAWPEFTVAGRWFIALQAEVVFVLGVLQIVGLRRLGR